MISEAIVENNYRRHKLYIYQEEVKNLLSKQKKLEDEDLEAQMAVDVKSGEEEATEADRRPATTTEQTVTFSDDRQKITDIRPTDVVHISNDNPYFTESILQWISRPFPVGDVAWTSSLVSGSRIGYFPFPSSLFTLDPIWDKIANFNYFKGGVKFTIRVNGTRFHYGKLLFMWSPQSSNTGKMFDLTDNIFSASGFPHVLVSPTESETHEFIMPFAIPFPWVNLSVYSADKSKHRFFDIGTVYCYVLNKLGVAGSSTAPDVHVTVFAQFVNPQLAGYTETKFTKPPKTAIGDQSFIIDPVTATFNWSAPSSGDLDYHEKSDALEAQMGDLEAQMAINDEDDPEGSAKSRSGVISGVAERVASTANLFSRIPLIGGVANVVSGVASGVGSVARALGYCNPLSQETISRFKLHFPLYTHSHGLDNGVSLTLTPNAKLAPGLELLGGFPEEQSLAYLCGTPSLLYVEKWTSSNAVNHILVNMPVSPMVTCKASITGGVDVAIPTVLSFASQPFRYWRGSLRYYITVTCSAFHSGRLKISWTPNYLKGNDENSYVQVTHVLDIQDETDFSFSVPWLKHTLYAPLAKYNENTDTSLYNGYVTISVINTLTAPMTPIGDVYINIYVSACDDYQLNFVNTEKLYLPADKVKTGLEAQWDVASKSLPTVCNLKLKKDLNNEIKSLSCLYNDVMSNLDIQRMIRDGVPQPSFYEFYNFFNQIELQAERLDNGLEAQFMTRETIRSMDYKPLIPAMGVIEDGVVFGESPKTIKDVYKRATPIKVFGKNSSMYYSPFGLQQTYSSGTAANERILATFVIHYKQLYRFSRGSMMLRILNLSDFDNLSAGINMRASKSSYGTDVVLTTPAAKTDASLQERDIGNGSQWAAWNHIQPIECAIPFFSNVHGAVNCFSQDASDKYEYAQFPKCEVIALGAEDDTTIGTEGIVLLESGGDDFELMFQVGPPLISIAQL